ncbi:MAG: cytochrome c oxidase subunit II [Bacteroidales bacterium]
MSKSSSPGEEHIDQLFSWFLILAAVIMTVVIVSVLIGAIKYRSGKIQGEPKQITGNNWIEVIWTSIPLLILVFFFYFTVKDMSVLAVPLNPARHPDINITAHQWWWELQYPEYNFTTANELHVPILDKLLAEIGSADVIHDWWVPALGPKVDAIPGRSNYLWIDATKPGEYHGSCSEYCGTQHSGMRILVIASTNTEFEQWVKDQQKIPPVPTDSLGLAGYRLFQERTCSDCHSIAGTNAKAHIGPDLTHVAGRQTLASGVVINTPENMYKWVKNPQALKKGVHMPDFQLPNNEVKALVKYLEELK